MSTKSKSKGEKKGKIAIIMWGLVRSIKYTRKSINKNVFNILKTEYDYDIFIHTYKITGKYTNKRANESDIDYDNNQHQTLNPNFLIIDNQTDIAKTIDFEEYRTKGNPWPDTDSYQTYNNFILSLYSKKQATQLFESHANKYDYVIYMRPDVQYLQPFKIEWLEQLDNSNCLIPNFHHWNGWNDRMFISKPEIALYYGTLYNKLLEYSKNKISYSEKFLKDMLIKKKIKPIFINFVFKRIRADGKIANSDIILKPKN